MIIETPAYLKRKKGSSYYKKERGKEKRKRQEELSPVEVSSLFSLRSSLSLLSGEFIYIRARFV